MGKKGRRERDYKDVLIVILLIISIGAIAVNVWNTKEKKEGNLVDVVENKEVVTKNLGSIAIPGYEGITLKADSFKQDIVFNNPSQNSCYFVLTLFLEDGTLLWESDYIEPGKNSKPVELNQTLDEGTYTNSVLKYSCYSIKDERELNGAETKLTIWVK